ncbi:hypothetical protein F0562_023098 [Nyssa sinensis]|uniref:Leucine-rich repeat-containing N-terminal plant-type domain-containing protein n=1 Tax=Nyssa sinensis TaxID=561372 RepID=A0A5J5BGZ6_9ASTE|nr:hypothetical protein F0562_023098 [Nyssa sinensis]
MKIMMRMRWPLGGKCALLWVVMVLVQIRGQNGCFEEERMALLEFKAFLKYNGANADHLVPTWVDDRESDCCDWERVTCNRSTGHVMDLSLHNIQQIVYYSDDNWLLNVSLFLPFKELRTLNLSYTSFTGWIENEGFERLASLRKLEVLDLSSNGFGNSLFQSLGALTSLKILVLRANGFQGYFPALELTALRNLEMLDISLGGFNGSLPMQGFDRLSVLRKLETLNLCYNEFDNRIISSLSAITSLKMLNLRFNRLRGPFPAYELASLENLEMLDLSVNELTSTSTIQDVKMLSKLSKLRHLDLSWNLFDKDNLRFLGALPSLKFLSLADNGMEGSLSTQELSNIRNLEVLILAGNKLNGTLPLHELSLLENLEMLDLSFNRLGSLPIKDIKTLSNLSKLRHLDLSGNLFDKDILRFLGALPSLKFLSLKFNGLEGPLSSQELSNMSNLEVLILASNHLNGTLPLHGFESFRHLETLDLSGNYFSGSIPPSIGASSSLKALSLARNQLNGSLPIQGLCELKKLQELDLSQNLFEGILPPCLKSLTSLRLFDLSVNQFTGNISSSMIASLTSLEYLDLSYNHFEGLFSFSSFANHSKLEVVQFISDNDKFEVETEYSDWVPMFQLKILVLSNCNLNKLSRDFPKFLLHQNKLRVVDLSHNNLEGFPNWLLENNTELELLNMRNNSFIGQFHLPPFRNINAYWMDISDNHFNGEILANITEMLPYIVYLNLSRNAFEGQIPLSIGDIDVLETLDLSFNYFSGEVPRQLFTSCTVLTSLLLSSNRFHGQFFLADFNSTMLMILLLDNNSFTGTLSDVFSNCRTSLYMLDTSDNFFSGELPRWVSNMTSLRTLVMRNNSFKGQLPCGVFPYKYFDASHNSLSGSLPSCSNLQSLEHLHLQGNEFTGSIPQSFLNSSVLLTLNIIDNNLSGRIPGIIGALSNLRILLLGGNHFNGFIPNQLCHLNKIGIMDLSRNSFSGLIPHCFYNITFGNIGASDRAFTQMPTSQSYRHSFYKYGSILERKFDIHGTDDTYDEQVEVEFVTKSFSRSYKGGILDFMSGLDLSCNNLTGEIPHELGKLSWIHALNLSHNQLTGPIPRTFYNLTQIESLDLSYNNLSGGIPSELIALYFLAVFSVAHNNLSGRVPDWKAQFGTFDASSYDGNPFLCGPPLEKNCTTNVDSPSMPTASSDASEGKWYDIDPVVFRASFVATFIMFLLGFAAVLYVNPYWRRRWFYLVEECMYSCYYFVCDYLHKLSAIQYN